MIKIVGDVELRAKLAGLVEKLNDSETRQAFRAGAGIIRDDARRRAPLGKKLAYSVLGSKRTFEREKGVLRRSIVAFAPRGTKEPAAFARVNIFRGTTRALHGHLVEFGTRPRVPRTASVLFFRNAAGTGFVAAKRVAGVRPNPFFAPAVEAKGQQALDAVAAKTAAIIQRTIDRT